LAAGPTLIGHTGFVGGNLARTARFDHCYNTSNIEAMRGSAFDLVVCAGTTAVKWLANREPDQDWAGIARLIGCLREVRAARFVLISTVDVYADPVAVDETTPIDPEATPPYGRHRYRLEEFVWDHFGDGAVVVRLPGLFGPGLKKNFLYDLLHANYLEGTHRASAFQFYPLDRLWKDIEAVLQALLPLVNFATAPVTAEQVAAHCFGMTFINETAAPPVRYDMRTRHAALLGGAAPYLLNATACLDAITRFVALERSGVG